MTEKEGKQVGTKSKGGKRKEGSSSDSSNSSSEEEKKEEEKKDTKKKEKVKNFGKILLDLALKQNRLGFAFLGKYGFWLFSWGNSIPPTQKLTSFFF